MRETHRDGSLLRFTLRFACGRRFEFLDPHDVDQRKMFGTIGGAVAATDSDDHTRTEDNHLIRMANIVRPAVRGVYAIGRKGTLAGERVQVVWSHLRTPFIVAGAGRFWDRQLQFILSLFPPM